MAKPRLLTFAPPLIFAALAGVFLVAVLLGRDDSLPTTFAGQPAPQLPTAPLGDQPPFDRDDLATGDVALVNFWASWCGPCRVEHPNLERLAEEGLAIYGINYKDKDGQALSFLQELGSPYDGIVSDPEGRAALQWGVYGVPETFVIDGQGRIVDRIAGPVTQRIIEGRLAEALAQAQSGD